MKIDMHILLKLRLVKVLGPLTSMYTCTCRCGLSENEAWSEDENVSSSDSREDNVCNDALHVIGLYGPGDKVSLPWRLGAREGGVKLSHCPRYVVPGDA